MARATVNEDAKLFLKTLKQSGQSAGNGALRGVLGWTENRYWRAHELLLEQGKIMKGRGRGGSVHLV
jgi:type I restriction enzyme M protein